MARVQMCPILRVAHPQTVTVLCHTDLDRDPIQLSSCVTWMQQQHFWEAVLGTAVILLAALSAIAAQ